ncbi:MAG: hypothetical protein JO085_03970 [Acidimicrobiia bacterium]|nr:hypothetical protein [Acidimicrobiia bacterium]
MTVLLAMLLACISCGGSNQSATSSPSTSLLTSNAEAAVTACNGSGPRGLVGSGAVLRGAFQSTGRSIVRWQLSGYGKAGTTGTGPPVPIAESQFASAHATDQTVFVCYFDGGFIGSMPPPMGTETIPPQYNRARVFVSSSGSPTFDALGRHDTAGYPDMAVEAPPSS